MCMTNTNLIEEFYQPNEKGGDKKQNKCLRYGYYKIQLLLWG
jgi:hypothetical protein